MVVGGAPDKSQHHVEDVALVALSFRDEINNKNVLHTAIPIQIRIGFFLKFSFTPVIYRGRIKALVIEFGQVFTQDRQ